MRSRLGIGKSVDLNGGVPEHVEVVNFPKDILDFLEAAAPRLMQNRQETRDMPKPA